MPVTKVKTKKKVDLTKLGPDELLKYEVAAELGFFDQVMKNGWQSLTAKETGRIGGLVAKKKRMRDKDKNQEKISNCL